MSFNPHKKPLPHPSKPSRALYFGARVIPLIFVAGAVQAVLANYLNPLSESEKEEINERRQGKGFADSRLKSKDHELVRESEELLSRDDSDLLSADKTQHIDLSHLDQPTLSDETK